MSIKTTNVYTIDDHPNKQAVFEWVRNNWHDLNDHDVTESIDLIKKVGEVIGCKPDYAISQVSDRCEHIKFENSNEVIITIPVINKLRELGENYQLTGVGRDHTVHRSLETFTDDCTVKDFQNELEGILLEEIHEQTKYVYSDEGLTENLQCNDYYFHEDGSFHS